MAAIYQADLWCNECADDIRRRIESEGNAPDDPSDEASYDSDEYPKGCCDPGESDCPSHCAAMGDCLDAVTLPSGHRIGVLVGDDLTSDGVKYVREAIAEGGEVAEYWANSFAQYL